SSHLSRSPPPPTPTLFPYTTLFRSIFPRRFQESSRVVKDAIERGRFGRIVLADVTIKWYRSQEYYDKGGWRGTWKLDGGGALMKDRKSTRLNSTHLPISYPAFSSKQ